MAANRFGMLLVQTSRVALIAALMGAGLAACGRQEESPPPTPVSETTTAAPAATGTATADEAKVFVTRAEAAIQAARLYVSRASWVRNTFITDDTTWLEAKALGEDLALESRLAREAHRFDNVQVDPVTRRKLDILVRNLVLPAPDRPGAAEELAALSSKLAATYSTGSFVYSGKPIRFGDGTTYATGARLKLDPDATRIIRESRDPAVLRAVWEGWRTIAVPMKPDYQKLVELANEGAKSLGYADTGLMWRSKYDMDPAAFAQMTDRLWSQVMPFYRNLHCYVRARLSEKYGTQVQPRTGPIRAHLLGNMWAQEWSGIYDIVAPKNVTTTVDMNAVLARNGYMPPSIPGAAPGQIDQVATQADAAERAAAEKMMRTGEGFYSSIGFPPLPATFWQRTQFIRPRDREVVCHASAWDIDDKDDIRIKMCIGREMAGLADDFFTVHHELGHNYYQRAYSTQDYLFRDGANDGFHEAIGDFAALNAITPTYLQQIGLLQTLPSAEEDIPFLLRSALDGIAFVPFGLLVDKWRWLVFSGRTTPDKYNESWWALVRQYQGMVPPAPRPGSAFDPGAKFHIPDSTPYMRYFLARILQYQFYRSACRQAGWNGPLNRCSIYGNKTVGAKFRAMMEAGQSRPWPEVLAIFTDQREIDATAIAEYFKPLDDWLTEQNKSESCGWQ